MSGKRLAEDLNDYTITTHNLRIDCVNELVHGLTVG